MDAITHSLINALSNQYPHRSITLTHQFLDGTNGNQCGFVPNEWGGDSIIVKGQWWQKQVTNQL